MRVLLITPYFPPQPAVASLRTHAFARTFINAGDEVTVLTTEKRSDQTGWPADREGMEIVELAYRGHPLAEGARRLTRGPGSPAPPASAVGGPPTFPALPPQPSRLRRSAENLRARTGVFASLRMPDLTDGWVRPAVQWAMGAVRGWDLIVSSSGPYTAHLVALELRRQGAARAWIADFRDLWIDNHIARGLWPFTMRERRLHARCLRAVSAITTVSEPLANSLRQRLDDRVGTPVRVIYNGFDAEDDARSGVDEAATATALNTASHQFSLAYTGTLYPHGQDVRPILEAMRGVIDQRPDHAARLALLVAGQRDHVWGPLAQQIGIGENLRLHGVLPRRSAIDLQRSAQALLAIEWRDSAGGVLTGKVFEYLPRSAPILVIGGRTDPPPRLDPTARPAPLTADAGCIGALVESAGRGLALGSDPDRIRDALLVLLEDASIADRFAPDPDRIATYERRRQAARLRDLAASLLD